jgi:hypothetical protein
MGCTGAVYRGVCLASHAEIHSGVAGMKKTYQKPTITALGLLRAVTKSVGNCLSGTICIDP